MSEKPSHEELEQRVRYLEKEASELKNAETAARGSDERFRRAFDNMPDVVVIYDPDLRIRHINSAVTRYTGRPISDFLGKRNEDIWPPEFYNTYLPTLKEAVRTGTAQTLETEIARPGDEIRYARFAFTPLFDENKKVREILGITIDLTEHKNVEKERQKLEVQFRQAQKMEAVGSLAGGIAHDFNNILTSILGFTELSLEDAEKNSEMEDNLQEVYNAGKRAKELVKQILAVARQSEIDIKPVRVDIILKEALKFIRASIPATIKISQYVTSGSLVMGDAAQLYQVFLNLFTNAAYAMEEKGGKLDVGLIETMILRDSTLEKIGLPSGECLKITISDTGTGISPDIINSIFEPYFTTKPLGRGTGMGLAIVHGIVESCGGKIEVDSVLGQGTVFTLHLPISNKTETHRPQESETFPSGTERILIVDDEAPIVKITSHVLGRLGYQVTTRTSCVEALELFRNRPEAFDLVITDMTMPNMTGEQLAAGIKQIRSDIPVILCTGYSKTITDASVAEAGISSLLYKPVDKNTLAKTVRNVLDAGRGGA